MTVQIPRIRLTVILLAIFAAGGYSGWVVKQVPPPAEPALKKFSDYLPDPLKAENKLLRLRLALESARRFERDNRLIVRFDNCEDVDGRERGRGPRLIPLHRRPMPDGLHEMNFLKTLAEVRDFAVRAHGSQKYGEHQYVVHLDEVADLVLTEYVNCAEDVKKDRYDWLIPRRSVLVAYLHDVIEDTLVTREEIASRFGEEVALGVEGLTDPAGKNRRERKALLHERLSLLDLAHADEAAVILTVKAADRLANLRRSESGSPSLLKMYREEAAEFRKAAFRPNLCNWLWDEIDSICRP